MTTSYPGSTQAVPGARRAAAIGRRSRVALAGLIGAVTLVFGLGGAITSVAAAAVPSFSWATRGGGTGDDSANGVSALPDGSSIITGYFSGNASFGATNLTSAGAADILTAKVNADGSYAWATKGGGPNYDIARGVSTLPDGSSIITGRFSGTATFGTISLTSSVGSHDSFTAKLNADGSYAWAIKGGGTGADSALGVSALPDGSSIITGYFVDTASFGTTNLTTTGLADSFTAKVNADGSYAWATRAGGPSNDSANGVSALPDGSSIITGYFSGAGATFGVASLNSAGSFDSFTAKVNADGSYAWATRAGGTNSDVALGVSALSDGSSIITGRFAGAASFGATNLTTTGSYDSFTSKVNADGSYAWATKGGGTNFDLANGVSALPDGSSIITGYFSDTAAFGATNLTSAGSVDSFASKLNADGSYAWAMRGGGPNYDVGWGVSALPDGSSVITGSFADTASFGATILTSAGPDDSFTARILADAPQAPTGASASAGIRQATITWNAVAGGLVNSYTATAAPGGASCTAVAPATTCTITNLTAGTSYTATVTATNPQGTSPASQASNAVTPTAPVPPPTAPVNAFTMKPPKSWPYKITTQLNLPGPGKVTQVATTKLSKKARTMTVCKAQKTVAKAGWVTITCSLTAKARAARLKHSLKLRLVTTFTPTGGTAKSVSKTLVLKKLKTR